MPRLYRLRRKGRRAAIRGARRSARVTRRGARAIGDGIVQVSHVAVQQAEVVAERLTQISDIPLTAIVGWRRFVTGPYRRWAILAVGQGVVGALAGAALIIPLLLTLGISAAGTTALATLVLIGPAAQLAVPRLLVMSHGDLRRLTLIAAITGETRGLWLAAAAFLAYLGILPTPALVVLCALGLGVAGVFSGVAAANLQAWMAAVLPEQERRFAAPRVAGVSMAAGALVLVLAALLLTHLGAQPGPGAYAPLFALAGLAGVIEVLVLRRLRNPGKVRVPRMGDAPVADPRSLRNFFESTGLAAVGTGLAPYMSTYAIVILGAGAGFAVALSAATAGASVIAGVAAADLLANRSSSRFLRASWVTIAVGWLLAFGAAPVFPWALGALLVSSIIVAAGAAVAQLAVTERLFRLAQGPSMIAVQGRFVALSSVGVATGQIAGAGLLAVGPVGFLSFGILFGLSAAGRLLAASRVEVASSWATQTGVWRNEDLGVTQI